ncbi:MAG: OmpA family protein [Bacteroidales bacterium]|nr:OmpA family protein [Bacteroidales bacterium]
MQKKLYILILLFISLSSLCFGQYSNEFCNEIDDKKLIKKYDKAVELLIAGKLDEAELEFAKILEQESDFTEAWVAIAEINYSRYKLAQDRKSQDLYFGKYIKSLERITSSCPSFQNYETNYKLGKIFFSEDDFENSRKYLQTFIKNSDRNSKFYADAENTLNYIDQFLKLTHNPVPFDPVIVEGISTNNDEYLPIISPDGSMAFFTHRYMKDDVTSIYGPKYTEEYTMATAVDKTGIKFKEIEALPYPFNAGLNQGASSITIDNNTMFVTICKPISSDYDNCDIFYTTRSNNGSWNELRSIGANINGLKTWESQPSISSDGKTLYFASIRESNIGFDPNNPTSDIYFTKKTEDGSWGNPVNLGTIINTTGNEKSPFIHSDSQTLYFSSDGHLGIGGLDILFSKYRENEWSRPVNIGYPINTKRNDLGFIVNTQGTKAYFASNDLKGEGGWDIYSFELYPEARPEKVFLVKGQLIDDQGEALTEAKMEVRNIRTQEVSEGMVDSETGNYAVAVTVEEDKKDDDYLMVVKKEDYSFTSALIEPDEETFEQPVEINFEVKPIEVGKSVELKDIYYATASYTIDSKSLAVLDGFIEFLNDNPKVKIEIRGHTDNTGSYQTNINLSNKRAQSVYDYLISNGIENSRLKYRGYGPDKPIASNETEYGRSKNRRTEFFITEK